MGGRAAFSSRVGCDLGRGGRTRPRLASTPGRLSGNRPVGGEARCPSGGTPGWHSVYRPVGGGNWQICSMPGTAHLLLSPSPVEQICQSPNSGRLPGGLGVVSAGGWGGASAGRGHAGLAWRLSGVGLGRAARVAARRAGIALPAGGLGARSRRGGTPGRLSGIGRVGWARCSGGLGGSRPVAGARPDGLGGDRPGVVGRVSGVGHARSGSEAQRFAAGGWLGRGGARGA